MDPGFKAKAYNNKDDEKKNDVGLAEAVRALGSRGGGAFVLHVLLFPLRYREFITKGEEGNRFRIYLKKYVIR